MCCSDLTIQGSNSSRAPFFKGLNHFDVFSLFGSIPLSRGIVYIFVIHVDVSYYHIHGTKLEFLQGVVIAFLGSLLVSSDSGNVVLSWKFLAQVVDLLKRDSLVCHGKQIHDPPPKNSMNWWATRRCIPTSTAKVIHPHEMILSPINPYKWAIMEVRPWSIYILSYVDTITNESIQRDSLCNFSLYSSRDSSRKATSNSSLSFWMRLMIFSRATM